MDTFKPPSRSSAIVAAIRELQTAIKELQRQMGDVNDWIKANNSEMDRLDVRQGGLYKHIQNLRSDVKTLSNANKTRVANATFKKGMLLNPDVTSNILAMSHLPVRILSWQV